MGSLVPTNLRASPSPGDARQAPRRRILKTAIIAFNDRCSTIPCAVRDLSESGARLRVDGTTNVPATFELVIELDGLEASCQMVWRKANDIGVRFLSTPRLVAPKRFQVVAPVLPAETPSLRRKPKSAIAPTVDPPAASTSQNLLEA
jgi:hypothetical protein